MVNVTLTIQADDGTEEVKTVTFTVTAATSNAPRNLRVSSIANTTAVLDWDLVPGNAGYRVYRKTGTGAYAQTNTSTDENSTLTGLTAGTTYDVVVDASVGGVWYRSDSLTFATTGATPPPTPPAPTNLRTTSVTGTSVDLAWDTVSGATSYEVHKNDVLAATSADTLETIAGLVAGTSYTFKVRASVNGVWSAFSAPLTVTTTTTPPAGTRLSSKHPFTSASFVNTSIGSGAVFSNTDARTVDLRSVTGSTLNCARWSIPVWYAASTDPDVTVTDDNGFTYTFKVPAAAVPAEGTDLHCSIVQPDKRRNVQLWGAVKNSNTSWDAKYMVIGDLLGDGRSDINGQPRGARASAINHVIGLIRKEELHGLSIKHAVAFGIENQQLKSGYVWPANNQDSGGATSYTGDIPMGTLFAIPASVDINTLGLNPQGLALAKACQDYGAYVLIRSTGVCLYAEPAAEWEYPSEVTALRNDWAKVRAQLQVVTNNSSTNVGGGGTRRQPALPEVTAG